MSREKSKAANQAHMGRSGDVKHFIYCNEEAGKTCEEVFTMIASRLRGECWLPDQLATLVVVGTTTSGKRYVLNRAPEWAVEELSKLYGGELELKRVGNHKLAKITVHNMVLAPESSIIVTALLSGANSARAYCKIYPTFVEANTQELSELIDVLMELHMVRVGDNKDLAWMRRAYRNGGR